MNTKDLMIGDWVKINDVDYPYPAQVGGITKKHGTFYAHFPKWDLTVVDEKLEPVPLTPEILKKNGFYWGYPVDMEEMASNVFGGIAIEMPPKSWVWDEGAGVVSVIFPNESDGGMITCYLAYHLTLVFDDIFVHELQHALKLCGIDKEIEL